VSSFSAAIALPTETETPEFRAHIASCRRKEPLPLPKTENIPHSGYKRSNYLLIYEKELKNNYIQDKQVEKSTFRRGYKSDLLYVSAAWLKTFMENLV